MATIDIVILVPLVLGAISGFRKGFVMEIIALLALILGIVGGFKLMHIGMELLSDNFDISSRILPLLSFLLIFILIAVAVHFIGRLIKGMLKLVLLGGVDKIAGGILGLLKWGFAISILLWLTNSFAQDAMEGWSENSALYPYVSPIAPAVIEFVSNALPFAGSLLDSIQQMLSARVA